MDRHSLCSAAVVGLALMALLAGPARAAAAAEETEGEQSYRASVDALVALAKRAQAVAAEKSKENAALQADNEILREALAAQLGTVSDDTCKNTASGPLGREGHKVKAATKAINDAPGIQPGTPWYQVDEAPFGTIEALWQVGHACVRASQATRPPHAARASRRRKQHV